MKGHSMKKVLKNIQELSEWYKTDCAIVKRLVENPYALNELLKNMGILDVFYGHDRDIHKELGGYTIVISNDDNKELLSEYKELLKEYHCNIEDYEICESFDNSNGDRVSIMVYLISSDYGLVVATIMKCNKDSDEVTGDES